MRKITGERENVFFNQQVIGEEENTRDRTSMTEKVDSGKADEKKKEKRKKRGREREREKKEEEKKKTQKMRRKEKTEKKKTHEKKKKRKKKPRKEIHILFFNISSPCHTGIKDLRYKGFIGKNGKKKNFFSSIYELMHFMPEFSPVFLSQRFWLSRRIYQCVFFFLQCSDSYFQCAQSKISSHILSFVPILAIASLTEFRQQMRFGYLPAYFSLNLL